MPKRLARYTTWLTEIQALSLRVPLIPTISHTLSGALYKNIRSTALKDKFELLWKSNEKALHSEAPEKEDRDSRLSRARATTFSIWGLLACELFEPRSVQQLKELGGPKLKDTKM